MADYKMECPECNYNMTPKDSRAVRSSIGKMYDWTKYHCTRDDIWVELEVPQQEDKA